MPESAKIEGPGDRSPDLNEIRSSREDDECAKLDLSCTPNCDFSSSFLADEENDFNGLETFHENFHAGYKRDSEHR